MEKAYHTYLNPHPGIPMVMITKTTTWAKNMKKNAKKLKELSVLKGAAQRKKVKIAKRKHFRANTGKALICLQLKPNWCMAILTGYNIVTAMRGLLV